MNKKKIAEQRAIEANLRATKKDFYFYFPNPSRQVEQSQYKDAISEDVLKYYKPTKKDKKKLRFKPKLKKGPKYNKTSLDLHKTLKNGSIINCVYPNKGDK